MLTIEQAQAYYQAADPTHDFNHVLRVVKMAEYLARLEGADVEVVRAAALLHDIARPADANHTKSLTMSAEADKNHAGMAARQARHILAGEAPDFVEAVVHAIEAHRFRGNIEPCTLEAQILFDADKLDAIGAIGVARAFAYAGAQGWPLWGSFSEDSRPGESDGPHTPLHEFHVKLKHIKDRLYTASGRRIAEARHAFMVAFYQEMAAEVEGTR